MKKMIWVFLAAAILTGSISYFFMDSQMYSYGNGTEMADPAMVRATNEILLGLDEKEYSVKLAEYYEQGELLNDYIVIVSDPGKRVYYYDNGGGIRIREDEVREIRSSFSYTESEARRIGQRIWLSVTTLRRAIADASYASGVRDRAERLMTYEIFDERERKQISRTGADFFALGDVKITAFVSAGWEKLLADPFGRFFSIAAILICAYLTVHSESGRDYAPHLVVIVGSVCVFAAELLAAEGTFGLGYPGMSIQSIPQYLSCRYRISLWQLIVLYVLFQVMGSFLLYLIACMALRMEHPIVSTLTAISVSAVALSVLHGSAFDPCNFWQFDRVIGVYENTSFFGGVFSPVQIFVPEAIILLAAALYFFHRQSTRLRKQAQEKAERLYLEDLNEKHSQIRTMRHDMNNHLTAAYLLLKEGRNDEAKDYIGALIADISSAHTSVETGSRALNMLLWNKAAAAKEMGIEFTVDFSDDYSDCGISDYELCSLYGNIIDNALKAAGGEEREKKYVKLCARRQMDMICIFCENAYSEIRKENGRFLSTRDDPKGHGLGLSSIERIAKKHGGHVEIDTDDGCFFVSVLLTASRA